MTTVCHMASYAVVLSGLPLCQAQYTTITLMFLATAVWIIPL